MFPFPTRRKSWNTLEMLEIYILLFISSIDDHLIIFFADKIPMKKITKYGKFHVNIMTGMDLSETSQLSWLLIIY